MYVASIAQDWISKWQDKGTVEILMDSNDSPGTVTTHSTRWSIEVRWQRGNSLTAWEVTAKWPCFSVKSRLWHDNPDKVGIIRRKAMYNSAGLSGRGCEIIKQPGLNLLIGCQRITMCRWWTTWRKKTGAIRGYYGKIGLIKTLWITASN